MACCSVCHAHNVELHVNEMWAGTWHSACFHEACLPCIRHWVEASLPQCRDNQVLRVQCYAPGCRKLMPQKLVLAASFGARLLAEAIDKCQERPSATPCATCGLPCASLTNKACGHAACENCWELWAQIQLPVCNTDGHLRAQCLHPGCSEPVETHLWKGLLTQTRDVQACIRAADNADVEMLRLQKITTSTRSGATPTQAGPVCPICQEHRFALLLGCDQSTEKQTSSHVACEDCWAKWFEEQLPHCRSQRAATVRCIGCPGMVGPTLWEHTCTRTSAVNELDQLLCHRQRLQQSALFPAIMHINCPQPLCVGLGYLGYDTVMCFLCEHQWSPEDNMGEPPPDADVEIVMGVCVKRCPQCFQYIEKNGGCDHMTCLHRDCGYEFFWSTLKPYKH